MTHTERIRFVILIILLIILVGLGLAVDRFKRQGKVGADILGVIQNQAASTFKSEDGLELTTLSDISEVKVSSGVNKLTINYSLGKGRPNQNSKLDVQFFSASNGQLVTTLKDLPGQAGTVRIQAKNIPNGSYDIAVKPRGFLSQVQKNVAYANNTLVTLEFGQPFKWGDIDISHGGKGDNVINNADWAQLVGDFNQSSDKSDFNGDGKVNSIDSAELLANWGPPGDQFQPEALDTQATDLPSF